MASKHQADLDLIAQITLGDRAAWQRLIEEHQRDLCFAFRRAFQRYHIQATPETLEDLQADLMLLLVNDDFRRLRGYSGRSSLRQWLKVVASNYTIDFLRRKRSTVPISTVADDPQLPLYDPRPGPHDQLEQQELAAALEGLLSRLNDEDRLFVELYYSRGHSFEQVATLMATTLGAVYARKNRLRRRLLELAQEALLISKSSSGG